MNQVIESPKFSLNWRDLGKGVIVSALTSALVVIQNSLGQGELTFNWTQIGSAAVASIVAYLFKNLVIEPPKTIVIAESNEKLAVTTQEIKQTV